MCVCVCVCKDRRIINQKSYMKRVIDAIIAEKL